MDLPCFSRRFLFVFTFNLILCYKHFNRVEARSRPDDDYRSLIDVSSEVNYQMPENDNTVSIMQTRRTSIIYLDATEPSRPPKHRMKKSRGKKKKLHKKKNGKVGKKRRRRLLKSTADEGSSIPNMTSYGQSEVWNEVVPESNQSESTLSGEPDKNRKPVDIIVHIKMKEK